MSFESGGREIMSKSRPSIVSPLPRAAFNVPQHVPHQRVWQRRHDMRQYQQLTLASSAIPAASTGEV